MYKNYKISPWGKNSKYFTIFDIFQRMPKKVAFFEEFIWKNIKDYLTFKFDIHMNYL